jgi:putative heme-binding domain-containing protein
MKTRDAAMPRLVAITILVVAAGSWAITPADDPKKPEPKKVEPRKPWTTSKITGSPEPPPAFKAVRVFPNVKLNHPLLIAKCPGSDRIFVGEQDGVLYSVANKPDAKAEVFFDLRKEIKTVGRHPKAKGIGELYGLVFHPKFEENRYCYVCYTLSPKDAKDSYLPDGTRVSRFTVMKTDPPRIDPASEAIVITFQGGGHNGGDLHFSPTDGMLYISTGDGSGPNPPDRLNTGQDCSDLLSSILRIDVDHPGEPGTGEPGGVSPRRYSTPKDNPFVGMKDVRPEIWAFGFRNPWRMSFDPKGQLWVGDVGWELWEMVHKVEKGGNYGWSIVEGRQPVKPNQKPGPTPIRPPAIELPHTIAASVTGGYVYRGKKFPELVGAYVFGDWETRRVWAARFEGEGDRLKEMPEIVKPSVRPSCFGEDNAGELYFFDYDNGMMFTLAKNDAAGQNANFPKRLSETGLFKDVKKHEMAEGVEPYAPNAPQWMDGALAMRYVALPNGSSIKLFDKARKLPGQVYWHEFKMQFPKDTVLLKTLFRTLPTGRGLIETQLLHFNGEDWRGYSYVWRADQSDADLVEADGGETEFDVDYVGSAGNELVSRRRRQHWNLNSRIQCLTCHNAWSEYALSFTVPQLNNGFLSVDGTAGPAGRPTIKVLPLEQRKQVDGDLITFTKNGIIQRVDSNDKPLPPFDKNSAKREPRLVNPYVVGSDITTELSSRSYLHVNCAHCHRFGGGGGQVVLELDFSKPLKEMGVIDQVPKQGNFGIRDARLISPGDPDRSVLLYRMATFGAGRMPHLGSEWPDDLGLQKMAAWIRSMKKEDLPSLAKGKPENLLRDVGTALPVALQMQNSLLSVQEHSALLAAAAKLPPGPVRDLFEGYLPPDPKGRKLGSNPRPASILAKTGDPKNGEAVFFNKELKCASCHKIGDKCTSVGPDLSAIGKTRTKAELLDSILNPSAKVDPQFASYLVKTHDGRSFTGLLAKRDEKQLVLRDAENKETVLAADNVEAVQPSRLSLMPDGAVSGLRPQEAADLLEFLASRK